MNIIKRNGTIVEFNKDKIIHAIENAMLETETGVDHDIASNVADEIYIIVSSSNKNVNVEEIQDLVEIHLMKYSSGAAKRYILYRSKREKIRTNVVKPVGILSDEFISKYKHMKSPMDQLGNFVYYRTYSRYLPEENRREYWWETVRRAVEYNCSLAPINKNEAEELYDNIFNLRQFLSGRTMWAGNTAVSIKYPMSNYNCSFQTADSFISFKDVFYLLMVGSGAGVAVLREFVEKLPKVRTNYEVIHESYHPIEKSKRLDNTSLNFKGNNMAIINIGDSKEGWAEGLDLFFKIITSNSYKNIETIRINYDHVRPKGERLKTFGGTASGHQSIQTMFYKIDSVIRKYSDTYPKYKLKPIDCLDIYNIIGENVVSGGVRRTSEIILVDPDDEECLNAKSSLYYQEDGKWVFNKALSHRQMSNNSIYYKTKPTREFLHKHIQSVKTTGEPGWINAEAASKRRENFKGVNPCGEVLLDSKGLCNLTTVNVMAFVKDGNINISKLLEAQILSARSSYRMTCPELELPEWNDIQQRDKLLGCSLTGWQDMVNATNMSIVEQKELLESLRKVSRSAADNYAEKLGMKKSLLITTVKPEGTLSLLPTVSCGVHYSHSPYYIRRVRISADDALVKVCEELGYPVYPEVGQDPETCTTKVVEFPNKAPIGKTKKDISAIDQLEIYKMFMESYVDHNASITVTVKEHEWNIVEEWLWDNWDEVVGLTLIPDEEDNSVYELMPFEECSEEEYNRRISEMKPFIPSLISKYETEEIDSDDPNMNDCATGICPVR